MKRLSPWLALLPALLWVAWPFWVAGPRAFGDVGSGDELRSWWLFEDVAETLREGGELERVSSLGWPLGYERRAHFASWALPTLLAPLSWVADFPAQWNLDCAAILMINVLGLAALARGAGAGPWGMGLAGAVAALDINTWHSLAAGKANTAAPGLAWLAAGLCLGLARGQGGPGAVALAVLAGGLAAAEYPPFLAFALPMALISLSRPQARGLLRAAAAALLSLALVWPELDRVLHAAHARRTELTQLGEWCRGLRGVVSLEELQMGLADAHDLHTTGVQSLLWLAAPALVLLRRDLRALALALLALLFGLLSLGPCLLVHRLEHRFLLDRSWWPSALDWLAGLHSTERLLIPAQATLGLCLALTVESGRPWLRPLLRLAGLALCLRLAQGVAPRVAFPGHWLSLPRPLVTELLETLPPGAALILPASEDRLLVDALYHRRPRWAPWGDRSAHPLIQWWELRRLGSSSWPPSREAAAQGGLRFVVLDLQEAGQVEVARELEARWGPPEVRRRLRWWELSAP